MTTPRFTVSLASYGWAVWDNSLNQWASLQFDDYLTARAVAKSKNKHDELLQLQLLRANGGSTFPVPIHRRD